MNNKSEVVGAIYHALCGVALPPFSRYVVARVGVKPTVYPYYPYPLVPHTAALCGDIKGIGLPCMAVAFNGTALRNSHSNITQ